MKKANKIKNSYLAVTTVVSASLLAGCDGSTKQWKAAPGTNGLINMDDVGKAFKKHKKADDFEKRINEIYEGDNLVVFRCKKTGGSGFVYYAYEDLDKDTKVSQSDDLLFTLTVANSRVMLQGAGVNKYYQSSWAYKPAGEKQEETYYRYRYHHHHFHYWYWGRGWSGYYTPRSRYNANSQHRKQYRGTSGFTQQVRNNATFEKRAASKYGSGCRKSTTAQTASRKLYIKTAPKAAGFKTTMKSTKASSGWGVRANNSISSSYSSVKRSASSRSSSRSSSSSRGGRYGGSRGSSGFGV